VSARGFRFAALRSRPYNTLRITYTQEQFHGRLVGRKAKGPIRGRASELHLGGSLRYCHKRCARCKTKSSSHLLNRALIALKQRC
jgi:hypothetical protein